MQPSFSLCKHICQQNFFLPYIGIVPFVHGEEIITKIGMKSLEYFLQKSILDIKANSD